MRSTLLSTLILCSLASAETDWRSKGDAAFAQGDWETAVSAYGQVVEGNDQDAQSWFRLAFALHSSNRLDEAITAHQKAARFANTKPMALYNLACTYALKGERDAALESLEGAVEAGFLARRDIGDDADFGELREDRAFQELARRANVYRSFDFWIGTWEVVDPNGVQVGSSEITLSEGGMLITEKWTNAQGITGSSMNFFDPVDGKWHQIWVDPEGTIARYVGGWSNGAMAFTGVSTSALGRSSNVRMTFTPAEDGSVRQLVEQSVNNGTVWMTSFDGVYRRHIDEPH